MLICLIKQKNLQTSKQLFDEWRSSLHSTIDHPMTVVCEATLGDFLWVKRFSYGIHVATFMRLPGCCSRPCVSLPTAVVGVRWWRYVALKFRVIWFTRIGNPWCILALRFSSRSFTSRETDINTFIRKTRDTIDWCEAENTSQAMLRGQKHSSSARNSLKPGESLHVFWGKTMSKIGIFN